MTLGIWQQAVEMAARTPTSRNRYVDFLRAVSIGIVIVGHWLMATVFYSDGELISRHVFAVVPETRWLTWAFQVMPIFFIVGGYSNAVSLDSARRRGIDYAGWLSSRLFRLAVPALVLVFAWTVIALLMRFAEVSPEAIQLASRASLIPTWFLAIYIMVVILAPPAYAAWRRYGFVSFWLLVAMAVLMDAVFFAANLRWPSWSSYFWVWLAIHSLGFAWRDGRTGSPRRLLALSALALISLALLVFIGPYPLAMIGSPDMTLSNTTPPKVTLIALALFQFGLLLAVETPLRRLLDRPRLWAATVLVNGMIMSIYLWHITVMVLLISGLYLAGGPGLGFQPGTSDWWLSRPVWVAVLLLLLVPLALLLSPLERMTRRSTQTPASPARQVTGASMVCLGIALLALFGYSGGPLPWLDMGSFGLVVAGAIVGGLYPRLSR